jgi:hypothetical protein
LSADIGEGVRRDVVEEVIEGVMNRQRLLVGTGEPIEVVPHRFGVAVEGKVELPAAAELQHE